MLFSERKRRVSEMRETLHHFKRHDCSDFEAMLLLSTLTDGESDRWFYTDQNTGRAAEFRGTLHRVWHSVHHEFSMMWWRFRHYIAR